jgi:hypothetical protein
MSVWFLSFKGETFQFFVCFQSSQSLGTVQLLIIVCIFALYKWILHEEKREASSWISVIIILSSLLLSLTYVSSMLVALVELCFMICSLNEGILRVSILMTIISLFPLSCKPWQLLFYSQFLWVSLFQIVHISMITQYLSFSFSLISLSIMPSRSVHIVTKGRMAFHFFFWIIFQYTRAHTHTHTRT